MIEQNELLREISEDIKREKLRAWWKNFGRTVVTVSLGVVLLTVGVVLWQQHQQKQYMQATDAMLVADRMEKQGKFDDAATRFQAIAKETRGDFSALARIRAGNALERAGNSADAILAYQSVVDAHSTAARIADIARLRLVSLMLAKKDPSPEALSYTTRLLDEARAKGRPYAASAEQLHAAFMAGKSATNDAAPAAATADERNP